MRRAQRRSEAPCHPHTGLLREAWHWARIRATRWLAMTRTDELAADTFGDRATKICMAHPGKFVRQAEGSGARSNNEHLETAACNFVPPRALSIGIRTAKTLFFLMTTFGAGKSHHGRFRRPSPLPCVDGHGPRLAFWTCDQQLIRLHCTRSAIV